MKNNKVRGEQKQTIINKIRKIIEEFGTLSPTDMKLEGSPIYKKINKDSYQLIECFLLNGVDVVTYVHETETADDNISYGDLNKEILSEILFNLENYKVEQDKLMESCRD